MPGGSVFLRNGDSVFHSYSAYGQGTDLHNAAYVYLDLTPLGRQEGWAERRTSTMKGKTGYAIMTTTSTTARQGSSPYGSPSTSRGGLAVTPEGGRARIAPGPLQSVLRVVRE